MKDLKKALEAERKKLNKLAREALRRSGLTLGAYASGAGSNGILLGKVIQKQSSKVDRIIMKIYREGNNLPVI